MIHGSPECMSLRYEHTRARLQVALKITNPELKRIHGASFIYRLEYANAKLQVALTSRPENGFTA